MSKARSKLNRKVDSPWMEIDVCGTFAGTLAIRLYRHDLNPTELPTTTFTWKSRFSGPEKPPAPSLTELFGRMTCL